MPHIWSVDDDAVTWDPLELSDGWYAVTVSGPVPCDGAAASGASRLFLRSREHDSDVCLLFSESDCRVNGRPLLLGLKVLEDRDEILIDGTRHYYSSESTNNVQPFTAVTPAECPRCRQAIEHGIPSVVCPSCGLAYHEDESIGLGCWTYAPSCLCGHPTLLETGYRWNPANL